MKTISRVFLVVPLGLILCLLNGCIVGAHYDAVKLREAALAYNEEQVIDNLVRAKRGQLILQVKMSGMDAHVETTAGGSLDGGQTLTRGATAAASSVVRPFTFSFNPLQWKDTLDITTVPVMDDVDAYAPYIAFLQLRSPSQTMKLHYGDISKNTHLMEVSPEFHENGPLCCSEHPPAENEYIEGALKKKGGKYYYVPASYRHQYFAMCIALINYGVYVGEDPAITTETAGTATPVVGKSKKSAPLKLQEQTNTLLRQLRNLRY